jgi:prevent-host-death family protein
VKIVTIREAKTNLSLLLAEVENGGDVVIARGCKPIARLVALAPSRPRLFGGLKGIGNVTPEFFEPLPQRELEAWDGK